ncbi:CysB family HTH-type transcriptional regulator [Massilia horti]|uniref:CysB family HTH-type transcriptional regulator n=1 Tax=Massilia horti TaxID=2562153 RepID=A0A4Y9SVV9_9BURK|nr:CysB family HTH-type transcriptional regulator [Massilia horti]TFW30476.1 CysB family HTH-type transcriptional regulator [Massilia horti]TFW30605.1 CysB family HTH-type transcriptional regulator [Massilia horti]
MNFQQLRSVREAARRGYNLTDVANALFTSQPGVSRQIRELEEELGVVIFERNGKRLTGLTKPGKGILTIIERLLVEAENLQHAGREYADQDNGTLTVAVTHTQARYALPQVVQAFRAAFPNVRIALQQSAPEHIAQWVLSGRADIGIATEGLSAFPDLVSFPCYRWSHLVVAPDGHPLLGKTPLGLRDLANYPLITYDVGFTGRGHIDAAFAKAGLAPDIVLTAMDSDVIKQYVSLGMGVGIVAAMAFDHGRDKGLRAIEASHLFAQNVTRLAVRRGAFLRAYAYHFIERLVPGITREQIESELYSAA